MLAVNLQVVFKSSTDKEKFKSAIGVSVVGIGNLKESFEKAKEKSKVSGNIIISAIQMGGDPENLAKIFNKKTDGGYYAASCSMDSLDDCDQIINGTLDYAQTVGKQIKTASGDLDHSKFYYGFPKFTLYETLGIKVPKVNLELANINNLLAMVKKNKFQNTIINHFLPLRPTRSVVADQLLEDLNEQLEKLDNRRKYFNFVATTCFAIDKTSAECSRAIEEALNLFNSDEHYIVNDEAVDDLRFAWHYQNPIGVPDLKHDVIFQPLTFGNMAQRLFMGIDRLGNTPHELYLNLLGSGINQLAGLAQLDNNPYFDLCDFEYGNKDGYGYQHGGCTNSKQAHFFARIKRVENPQM